MKNSTLFLTIQFFLCIFLLSILICGCSADAKASIDKDKSDVQTTNQSEKAATPDIQTVGSNVSALEKNLSYPISDDWWVMSDRQDMGSYLALYRTLLLYRLALGNYPSSLEDFVQGGFPILWPRNLASGKPVKIIRTSDLSTDVNHFGCLKYSSSDQSQPQLSSVTCSGDAWKALNRIPQNPLVDYHWEIYSPEFPSKLEGITPMMLSPGKSVNDVGDSDSRMLLAMFGQLTDIMIEYGTSDSRRYGVEVRLPISLTDLLGPDYLIIKENYDRFVELVNKSDVEFKWGNINNKVYSYVYLKINDTVYIKLCRSFAKKAGEEGAMGGLEILICDYDTLDTTSPIITEKNIGQLRIPDEYFISIKDIPVVE